MQYFQLVYQWRGDKARYRCGLKSSREEAERHTAHNRRLYGHLAIYHVEEVHTDHVTALDGLVREPATKPSAPPKRAH